MIAAPCDAKAIVFAIARARGGGGISGSGASTFEAAGLVFVEGASAFEEGAGPSTGAVVVNAASYGARFTR